MGFVHLHCHSHMSILNSTIKIPDLITRVQQLGMDSVALTDRNNMFGMVQFMKAARKKDIKPILGAEVFIAGEGDDCGGRKKYELVLLAKDLQGYHNLVKLVSKEFIDGLCEKDGNPSLERGDLAQYSEGLVALSGGLAGEVPNLLLAGKDDAAQVAAAQYKEIFGSDFYLEVVSSTLAEQVRVNGLLAQMGLAMDIPLIATSNCHYLYPQEAKYHALLVAIEHKLHMDPEALERFPLRDFYLQSEDEIRAFFKDMPQAVDNTVRVAQQVTQYDIGSDQILENIHFPIFEPPDGMTPEAYLTKLAKEGLQARLKHSRQMGEKPDESVYMKRLERELDVITRMNFSTYYLIVWEIINWSKTHDVPVGPGRGSGAGSLVAYAIRITEIDPIRYKLMFERFLNPERISPPDFDIDFCKDRRSLVRDHVVEKYGQECVSQILALGTLKPKAAIKDVARVMNVDFSVSNRMTNLVPMDVKDPDLVELAEKSKDVKKLVDDDPRLKYVYEYANHIKHLNRQTGMHAAGVIISDRPITDYAPLYRGTDGEVVLQLDKQDIDYMGLIKFDLLGLSTLTYMDRAAAMIKARHNPDFDITRVAQDDQKVYRLLSKGDTSGVFQVESTGFTQLIQRMKPNRMEDLIAAVALYRPGPLQSGMVDAYINRKHGRESIEYPDPRLKDLLEETYGVIVYQEQVMMTAVHLAGFSMGQADTLRKAMGKKKESLLAEMEKDFIEGCEKNGIAKEKAVRIYADLKEFGKYGFNKSHSAAYALLAYWTAYLKTYYPVEFYAALLTEKQDDQAEVARYLSAAKEHGIPVLPPDVNRSGADFTVEDTDDGPAIRFGLSAIKSIGHAVVSTIIEGRKDGPYESPLDFLSRVNLKKVNKKALEVLVKSGAFDAFGYPRKALADSMAKLVEQAQARKSASKAGATADLFAGTQAQVTESSLLEHNEEWDSRMKALYEHEAVGFFITAHPMQQWADKALDVTGTQIDKALSLPDNSDVSVAGIVVAHKIKPLKRGDGKMVFFDLEDTTARVNCKLFSKRFDQWEATLGKDLHAPVVVRGRIRVEGEGETGVTSILVDRLEFLEQAKPAQPPAVVIDMTVTDQAIAEVNRLRDLIRAHRGKSPVFLNLVIPGEGKVFMRLGSDYKVNADSDFLSAQQQAMPNTSIRKQSHFSGR